MKNINIEFKDITWDNLNEVLKLSVDQTQALYLQSVSTYLAQAYVNLKSKYKDLALSIYNKELLIGFLKVVFVPKDVMPYQLKRDSYMIDAFLIDQRYQDMGYGKLAFTKLLSLLATKPLGKTDDLYLMCYKDNDLARSFFKSFGFFVHETMIKNDHVFDLLHKSI